MIDWPDGIERTAMVVLILLAVVMAMVGFAFAWFLVGGCP